jgi:hypothetical protein
MHLFLYQIYILENNIGIVHLKRISIWGELKCEINCIFVNLRKSMHILHKISRGLKMKSAKMYSYWPLKICIGHLSDIYWTRFVRSLNYTLIFSYIIIK